MLIQALSAPIFSLIILAVVGLWVHFYTSREDTDRYSFHIKDFITRKQWWRIYTASFCHSSFFHMIFNVTALWGYRGLEHKLGSIFILKYTLLLMAFTKIISAFILYCTARTRISRALFANNTCLGISGEVFGWMAFSVAHGSVPTKDFVYIFGLLPVPFIVSPMIMIFFVQALAPTLNSFVNLVGIFSGILLGIGVLEVLPDMYWTICFLMNIGILILWSLYIPPLSYHSNSLLSADQWDERANQEFPVIILSSEHDIAPTIVPLPHTGARNTTSLSFSNAPGDRVAPNPYRSPRSDGTDALSTVV